MSEMLSVDEARAHVLSLARPRPAERLDLAFAAGRVLAEPIKARRDQPPFAASAMDGYAVRSVDVSAAPAHLAVIGEAPAGRPFEGAIGQGQAVRIFTGGVVPTGADCVVIQENTERHGDSVTVTEPQHANGHIRSAGIDFRAGDTLLAAGTKMEGAALALAASAGAAHVETYRPPIVGVLATGDELVEPGQEPGPSQIISSTPYALVERIAAWGGQPIALGIARDTQASLLEAIDAPGLDILVPIGGASVGEHDLVKSTLAQQGLKTLFEKVRMKPGKPTWFGTMGERLALGLPGNPASALVAAHLFLKPLLFALTGRAPGGAVHMFSARLDGTARPASGRTNFLRAQLHVDDGGTLWARPESDQDSSLMAAFARSKALIHRPAGAPPAANGDIIEVLPLFDGM